MSDFKESLYKKKSFIYQIGAEYYAIGANTFAKVTDSPEIGRASCRERVSSPV